MNDQEIIDKLWSIARSPRDEWGWEENKYVHKKAPIRFNCIENELEILLNIGWVSIVGLVFDEGSAMYTFITMLNQGMSRKVLNFHRSQNEEDFRSIVASALEGYVP